MINEADATESSLYRASRFVDLTTGGAVAVLEDWER